jgi:ankyrin repeat protein
MSACAVDAPIAFIDRVVARAAEEASAMGGLVPYMASTDGAGNSALILAASKGSVAIVKKLLALGVDVLYQNKRGQNALHRAVSRGHLETAEELLSYSKRQLGSNGKAADIVLSVVAESPDTGVASPSPVPPYRKFVNCRDAQGNTPLHYASMENNKELGQLLLRYGADRTIRNNDGKEFWEL